MKLKAISGMMLTLLMASIVMANIAIVLAPVEGDITGDGKVDLNDLRKCAAAFGSRDGDPNWDADADLNGDGIVNIFDLYKIARNYGKP